MNVSFFGFLITLTALVFNANVSAQLPGYKYFKLENDNREIKINVLFKNNRGYIFTGTNHGLYKFDGEKYIRINFLNPDYNDTVTAIFQDWQEKMWLGFNNGSIANVVNNKLVYFNPEEGTPQKKITAFLEDAQHNLWFSTNGEGIYFIKNKRMYLINADDGLSDVNVSSLQLTENGDVLAGTDQGINICNIRNSKKHITVIGPRQGLPDYIVTGITPAGKDSYWIGLQDKGFCLYDHKKNSISIPAGAHGWNYGQVNALLKVQNTVWLATRENGLYKYSIGANRLVKENEIVENNIHDMVSDNQGNIWLSAPNFGLVRTPGETLKLLPTPWSPVFEHIHAILCDKEGNIWLHDQQNKLIKIAFKNGDTTVTKIPLPGINWKTDITSLYQDIYGSIWVGTMGKGIFVIDPVSLKYREFSENSSFVNSGILSISGRNNSLFVSSLQGSMEINISIENNNIQHPYHFINFDNKGIGTNYIYSIFKDSRNRLWFATDGKGLTMFQNNTFTYYNDKDQIKDSRIYSITEDVKGNIWFSTSSAGIYKFDGKSFSNFGLNEGLSDLNISVVKTDNAGNIIIVHKKGLDILDPATENISYLNSSQGISMINVEDLGAVTNDTSGNIMVNTVDGILTYAFPQNSLQQPVAMIESVQLFLKDIDDSAPNVFSHDENNFTFNYTGLYYSDPEKLYYKYKLDGLDSTWVITNDRSKNFPKLEPGNYTFHIQSALNKSFKNAAEASYSFIIKKPFYKTYAFIFGAVLLFGILLYLYIKGREKALKRLAQLKQEKIQFQFEVLRNQVNPHFLFNSFNTLISTIEDDPHIAVEYAEQLSDFFRNIVNQRDKDIIPLKDEIDSLKSYFFIQKKRYGNYLLVNIDVSDLEKLKNYIPPLTLQLLMENAIKHNAVSKETPLEITININEHNYLCIKNNMNRKITTDGGSGMGLQNIINRYNLLTNKKVRVLNDGHFFTVEIPLLK